MAVGIAVLALFAAETGLNASTPPSGEANRVLIAVQNSTAESSTLTTALAPAFTMLFADAANDNDTQPNVTLNAKAPQNFPNKVIANWPVAEPFPSTVQSNASTKVGSVYSEDGSLTLINFATEAVPSGGSVTGLAAQSSSIYMSANQQYVYATGSQHGTVTVIDRTGKTSVTLSLPGANNLSVNAGQTVILIFSQNSNGVYYLRKLDAADQTAYGKDSGPASWPANAVDCEPFNLPTYCIFQVTGTGVAAVTYTADYFDHPLKAVFSADGSKAYILNAGPASGGTTASVTVLPVAPLLLADGTESGTIPATPTHLLVPDGASNGVVSGTTLYVAGQSEVKVGSTITWAGYITPINTTTNVLGTPLRIADGEPARMAVGDDSTIWVGSQHCNEGANFLNQVTDGCMTRATFPATGTPAAEIDPWKGDVTAIAPITGFHKVYVAEGGQVYIYCTVSTTAGGTQNCGAQSSGSADPYLIPEAYTQYVQVAGKAVDVIYMDSAASAVNTVY